MANKKGYYLLDMGEYEKIVNNWNKYGKQNEIITINRAIKDQVYMEEFIHKNKIATEFHKKVHELTDIALKTKDPIEKEIAKGMVAFIRYIEKVICGRREKDE